MIKPKIKILTKSSTNPKLFHVRRNASSDQIKFYVEGARSWKNREIPTKLMRKLLAEDPTITVLDKYSFIVTDEIKKELEVCKAGGYRELELAVRQAKLDEEATEGCACLIHSARTKRPDPKDSLYGWMHGD